MAKPSQSPELNPNEILWGDLKKADDAIGQIWSTFARKTRQILESHDALRL